MENFFKNMGEVNEPNGESALHSPLAQTILDSSLIVTTNKEEYDTKVINCNDYIQVYFLTKTNIRKNKNIEPNKNDNNSLKRIDTDKLIDKNNNNNNKSNNSIELKNIIRSKLQCQRLAKCNISEWKTFITLTFEENVTNIKYAGKRFRYFVDKIQRISKNFKYICIPEFQKRGAVHYHLLTNISINDSTFIYSQIDNPKFKHIKYWNEGFTKVDSLEKDIKKIIGYISKYMTKDIDNRLYNCHRYYYSRNLNKPTISFLNLSNPKHQDYYKSILKNKKIIYENDYINDYTNQNIKFKEFL